MTDDQALLCPARAKGFSLSEKRFAWFLVDHIKEIDFSDRAYLSLALPEEKKTMVKNLAQYHSSSDPDFDDVVAGKGQGMVISLKGPPGLGKTLTAESIADLTHKPFYSISTGELGTDSARAETKLREIFKRGKRWNAAVLLDEADLFLTKRTTQELDRNALVNVFLRNLEYYQGLLFLTSNRIETFDPAFDSRIHLHVSFDNPDAAVRTRIWQGMLPKDWPQESAEKLGRELPTNGREIKHLIRTATLLAKSNGPGAPLEESVIRKVYKANCESRLAWQNAKELEKGTV